VSIRFVRRLAIVSVGAAVPLLVTAGPALAHVKPDDGEVPGPALGIGQTLLLFVVIPVGAFLLIAGLALLPSALSRPRYRPGKPWDHEPRWVGGPADVFPAVTAAAAEPTARGGASAEW
jgi:hypothetical protein